MWYVYMLMHLVGLVGYSLLLRKSLIAKADKWAQATIMQTAIAVPILLAALVIRPDLGSFNIHQWFLAILIAIFTILLHWTNVMAVARLEAGTYSILYNTRLFFVTILGIVFLGEKIVPLQLLGGVLIFLAVFVVRQRGPKHLTRTGLAWGLMAALTISILNIFEKKLVLQVGFFKDMLAVSLLATPVMWAMLFARGGRIPFSYLKQRETIIFMVLRAISAYGFILAFSVGLLSVTSYISGLSVVVIMILGALWLDERDHPREKIVATTLAAVGLTVILLSKII
jgi:drug/metabolite transporter (DMT)-like permease